MRSESPATVLSTVSVNLPRSHILRFVHFCVAVSLVLVGSACNRSSERTDGSAFEVERVEPDSQAAARVAEIVTPEQKSHRHDSLWEASERLRPRPQVEVRWTSGQPKLNSREVRGRQVYWFELEPYVVNVAGDVVQVHHFRHLGMPTCRAHFNGRWLNRYDYEDSGYELRASSRLSPQEPYQYRGSSCSIPIERKGTYVVVAEALIFSPFTSRERSMLNRAHDELSTLEAIQMARTMRRTRALTFVSRPVVVEVH